VKAKVKNIPILLLIQDLNGRLKFSGFERDMGLFVVAHRGRLDQLKQCKDLLVDTKAKVSDCRAWIEQVLLLDNQVEICKELSTWEPPKFPIG
jgi:hypothetical protein